jgi:hypothetical protein
MCVCHINKKITYLLTYLLNMQAFLSEIRKSKLVVQIIRRKSTESKFRAFVKSSQLSIIPVS